MGAGTGGKLKKPEPGDAAYVSVFDEVGTVDRVYPGWAVVDLGDGLAAADYREAEAVVASFHAVRRWQQDVDEGGTERDLVEAWADAEPLGDGAPVHGEGRLSRQQDAVLIRDGCAINTVIGRERMERPLERHVAALG